jgi:hypothetical protein
MLHIRDSLAGDLRSPFDHNFALSVLEETGAAQPEYDSRFDRRSRWNRYGDAGDEKEQDARSVDFEVIEVSDAWRYLDQWVDIENRPVDFGKLPPAEGEVLPGGRAGRRGSG